MAGYGNFIPSQFTQQEKSSLEAATEAAAKVNAMLIAKGKLRPNQVNSSLQNQKKTNPNNMVAAEVEINDAPLSMRNMLTRGPTQEEITKFSGAAVSTRGRYMTPVEKMKNNSGERPLYLFVQGPNQDSVNVAVSRINEILTGGKGGTPTGGGLVRTSAPAPPPMAQHQFTLPPHHHPPPHSPAPAMLGMPTMQMPPVHQPPPILAPHVHQPELQQITVLEEKLLVGLEHAPPTFDVKGKLLGPGGSYLMHIQTETGAKVMLRGKGSGFIEPAFGREAFEPMHIMIQHPSLLGLQQAKQLAENLIQTVQQTYASFQQVLASLPPTVVPGPTAYFTGIQQPTSIAEALMGPPPGLPNLSGLTEAQLVQSAPGMQHQQTVIVPSSSMSSVMMPAVSIATPISSYNTGQQCAPGVMLPTTISLAQVPIVSTLPISTQTLHLQAPPGALDMGQQQLIVNQPPPQPLAQMNLAPHMTIPASIASLASLPSHQLAQAPTFNHTMQLMTQQASAAGPPGLAPPPGPVPGPGQPPPYQTIYSPEVVSSGTVLNTSPVTLILSTAPSSHIYSLATSSSLMTTESEPVRRRFTEEKEDKIPENLLGYQHGPPHLVNLVCPSPPPGSQGQPGLVSNHPTLLTAQNPGQPGLQPAPQPGLPPPHPQMSPVPQPQQMTVISSQPGLPQAQPGLAAGQLGLQHTHPALQAALPPGHPGFPASFTLQPGIQVQTIHALHGQLAPPPNSLSPVSQPYSMPPSSLAEDNRFGIPVSSSSGGLMPPPPPSVSVGMPLSSNGEQGGGNRQLMPPPSLLPDSQSWATAVNGPKRGLASGERGAESDRKRRKVENGAEEEENGSQSPSAQSESPKPGTPTQGLNSRSQSYSPVRDLPPQDSFDHLQPPPPPPPHHPQASYQQQQFEAGAQPLLPHGAHIAAGPQPPPFDPAGHPPPLHQQFVEHAAQPPPTFQYQEISHQFLPAGSQGELGQFHAQVPPQTQGELGHPFPPPPVHAGHQGDLGHPYGPGPAVCQAEMCPPVSSQPPAHSFFPPFSQSFSQPGPPGHYITTSPVSTHSSFHPGPQFLPQYPQGVRHPHGPPPPPPPPPPSSQYQHGPPQTYWQS